MSECPCDRDKTVDPHCCAAGMCVREDEPCPSPFKDGDKVRDRANLGGTVLETRDNRVKVSWNNMQTGWIDEHFLHATPIIERKNDG